MIERLAFSLLLFSRPSFLSNFKSFASFRFYLSRYIVLGQFHHKQTWSVSAFSTLNISTIYLIVSLASRPFYDIRLHSFTSRLFSSFETADSHANSQRFNAPIGRKLLTASRPRVFVCAIIRSFPSSFDSISRQLHRFRFFVPLATFKAE